MLKGDKKQFNKWDAEFKDSVNYLRRHCPDFSFSLKRHPLAEGGVKKILGYVPSGKYQIIMGGGSNEEWSIIRGMVSFGDFEIMQIKPKSYDPVRFKYLKGLINYINEL